MPDPIHAESNEISPLASLRAKLAAKTEIDPSVQ